MARQRFIWPTFWDDPDLGALSSDARLLYIGCFSNADDDGRLIGEPAYLVTQVFRYRPRMTPKKAGELRDELAGACSNFCVYTSGSVEYIAFLNWSEYQKPKYPRPSKFPAPPKTRKARKPASLRQKSSGKGSGKRSRKEGEKIPGTIPPRVGLGWVGLGWEDLQRASERSQRQTAHRSPAEEHAEDPDPEPQAVVPNLEPSPTDGPMAEDVRRALGSLRPKGAPA